MPSKPPPKNLLQVVSGGQTGVDRAALDVAIELGIPHGGWCPRGRRAEDGRIPDPYALCETESPEYRVRTERNVTDSDATLILIRGAPVGGTALTVRMARRHARPLLVVDLTRTPSAAPVRKWLRDCQAGVVNVAGPRESQQPGIAAEAAKFLRKLFAGWTSE